MYQKKANRLMAALLATMLAAGMTACGSTASSTTDTAEAETTEVQASETVETSEVSAAELPYAQLPEVYYITYEVTDEDGVTTEVSKAVDTAGNVYYKTAEEEALYRPENGSYTLYLKQGDTFTAQDGTQYTADDIEDATADFIDCARQANFKEDLMDAAEAGESTVAGRSCTLYTASMETFNYKAIYEFTIDQETKVCLSWNSSKEVSGYEQESPEGFACTRFDTEVADLAQEMLG